MHLDNQGAVPDDCDVRTTIRKYYEDRAVADDVLGYVRLSHMRAWRVQKGRWFVQYRPETRGRQSRDTMLGAALTATQIYEHLIDVLTMEVVRSLQESGDSLKTFMDRYFPHGAAGDSPQSETLPLFEDRGQ